MPKREMTILELFQFMKNFEKDEFIIHVDLPKEVYDEQE